MRRKRRLVIAAAGLVALSASGAAIAVANGEDRDTPITGNALERARSAALAQIGGGRVTDSEIGDEEGAYEVEVTRADGSSFDVHLDRSFDVIDVSPDGAADRRDSAENGS